MKRLGKVLIPIFLCVNMINSMAQTKVEDLIHRLGFYSPQQCQLSVEHLQKEFGDAYAPPATWKETIKQLDETRGSLIARLKEEEKQAVTEAEALLQSIDEIFLANPLIQDKNITAVRRVLGKNARSAINGRLGVGPSNFQNNSELPRKSWDNQLVSLRIKGGVIHQKELFKPKKDVLISDPEPHFDADRILYSSIGTNDKWHLFELDINTGTSVQVTPEAYRDFDSFDGCYLPDGRIVFCSTGTFLGLPCTDGGNKMSGLFLYDPKTTKTRQLTFDQDSNWGPVVLQNGKVMYQRWEYADLPHSNSRLIFTMNPDGTAQRAYYGSNSYFPTAFFNARPIPNHNTAFVGIATGHHSVARCGRMLIIDPAIGEKEAEGVVAEIPHYGRKVTSVVRDRLPDGIYPQFLQPYPLSDKYFIVSMRASSSSLWGLYLVDIYNNITLIVEEEKCAYLEPALLEKQKTPPIIPDKVNPDSETANVFIQDIYMGGGLKGIPRGEVKKLRVGTYSFSPWGQGGLLGTIGAEGPWDVKRIIGIVDVEEDGSAMFTIPANTPVFIHPLDEEGKALQVMRSWFTGMPGETISCVGCHESRKTLPVPKSSIASRKSPQLVTPWYGEERGFSYRHEVQPVLDKYCVSCHEDENNGRPYLKGDKMITGWKSQISGSARVEIGGGNFSQSYMDLQRYVRRPGIESDMDMLVPMDVHADQTELMQILNKGHHNVKLDDEAIERIAAWIDLNAPYHGRRSDISSYHKAEKSYQLRAEYREMFGAPETDYETLPEIPTNIAPVRPEKLEVSKGPESISGWPFKNAINAQLLLGQTQMSIPIADGINLELVNIPAGEMLMGSTNHPDEMPRNKVEIDNSFWIGQFEITNEQFRAFDPSHDSRDEHRHGYQFGRKGYSMNYPNQPAVRISWKEAMAFCAWLSEKTGMYFTLPTEAQWEWACRAGTDTDFWFGDQGSDYSNYANLGDITLREFAACTAHKHYESVRIIDNANQFDDWIPRDTEYDDHGFISEPVGSYRRSPWDLFDMHGNVWEWTLSEYKPYPYVHDDGRNHTEQEELTCRVIRGGSWYDRPFRATSSFRMKYRDYQKVYNVGFRVVMIPKGLAVNTTSD